MYSMGERYWAADSLREPTANCPTRGACLSTAAYTNPDTHTDIRVLGGWDIKESVRVKQAGRPRVTGTLTLYRYTLVSIGYKVPSSVRGLHALPLLFSHYDSLPLSARTRTSLRAHCVRKPFFRRSAPEASDV